MFCTIQTVAHHDRLILETMSGCDSVASITCQLLGVIESRFGLETATNEDRVAERAKSTMYNQDHRSSQPEGTAGAHPHLAGDESRGGHFTSFTAFDLSLLVVLQRISRLRR
jgi:hypothetical protein